MPPLQPPRAPTDQLRLDCFQTLSRLQLIFEFRSWLEYIHDNVPRRFDSPLVRLWDCMSLGAPLCTLLVLLGSPTPRHLLVYAEDFNFDLSIDDRKVYIENFIQRVNLLEMQGQLSYGEVLKVDDFLNATLSGFSRVLRTINRILVALHGSYPGLFVVPHGSKARRASLLEQLLGAERVYVSRLADIAVCIGDSVVPSDAASKLYEANVMEASLEGFIVNCSRLIPYHNLVLQSLADAKTPGDERWDEIFVFTNKVFRTSIISSYRSLCANYLTFVSFLTSLQRDSNFLEEVDMILRQLSFIINRISEYRITLQAILDVTTTTNPASYDSLCRMTFEMYQLAETIDEVGVELRTMWSARHLKGRLGSLRSLNLDGLENAVLDDRLMIDPISGLHFSIFLFQTLLLCCKERHQIPHRHTQYPIKPWELGPALLESCPLILMHAIPTKSLTSLHCIDEAYFELNWVDNSNSERTIAFYPMMPLQYTQWVSKLETFVPRIIHSTSVPHDADDDGGSILSGISLILAGDETMYERRKSTARPWSLIGRKGAHSESSSFIIQTQRDDDDRRSILTPSLLQGLFKSNEQPEKNGLQVNGHGRDFVKGHRRHATAKSPLSSGFTRNDLPLDHTPTGNEMPLPALLYQNGAPASDLPDLSGKVVKEGSYPVAHGGHSDVWKAVWSKQGSEVKVAVKVLRNTTSDPQQKAKLVNRLHHELRVWKQLSHPHVLPLHGTVSNFGPYTSMVCPWMENGSVSKYLEKCGDILSIADRLRIISEIAEGLAYLHLCSIIHGDLTGANVLLTADLRAQLCDFGLSTIVQQSDSSQTRTSFTSGLGGAVRWADSSLFVNLGGEDEEWKAPAMTYKSDVYSLGSVMLEILSGRPPYHYVATDAQVVIELHKGNKPRRPMRSFVDDGQWDLIQWCWTQPPEDRPDASDVAERITDMMTDS